MANYIDGFVLPIPRDRLENYRLLVEVVSEVWKDHGALSYREFVADDLSRDGTRSFADYCTAADDEVVVFGWVEFESRAARDQANRKVAADPRMANLVETSDCGFDAERMVYGGFRSLKGPKNERGD
ncbi:MAG: DUF1428 domain-containing protein [Lysobacterales bacterium]